MFIEYPGQRELCWYRFITDDPLIAKKMYQRKDFTLAVEYLNRRIWDYRVNRKSLKRAKRTLASLTKGKVEYDALNDEYFVISGTYIDKNNGLDL
tara:strand:+ start:114 stop:398 length:285 start_codon:yes stop_codon:yes gene_type:complete